MDLSRLEVAPGILEPRGLSRREFLKLCTATAVALGLSEGFGPRLAEAAEQAARKKPVIWMQGQGCTGCSESTLSSLNPGPAEIVLDMLSIRYHPTIMAASGHVAQKAWKDSVEAGGYVLVLEGSIPTADPRFAEVEGKAFADQFKEAAARADLVVAAGSCASFGGIPRAGITKGGGVADYIKDKPVVNVPSCPAKPSRLLGTLLHVLAFKKTPELDEYKRPVPYYKRFLQHDNCPRRAHFEKSEFLRDWNDPAQVNYCLLYMGCKGPKTYTDCPRIWWNDGVNYCINAGSPCAGCTQPEFYDQFTPLYVKQENFPLPGVGGVSTGTVAKMVAGATGIGIAAHAAARVATQAARGEVTAGESKISG